MNSPHGMKDSIKATINSSNEVKYGVKASMDTSHIEKIAYTQMD